MLSNKMLKALNAQIAMEGAASFKYLAMASWASDFGLERTATFMFRQSEEEKEHMMKIVHYVLGEGHPAKIPSIPEPKLKYKDIFEVIDSAYKNEQAVSKSIHKIVTLALSENDHRTASFMQWYVDEQREEEEVFQNIIDEMKLIGKGGRYLYYIDKAIGSVNDQVLKEEGNA